MGGSTYAFNNNLFFSIWGGVNILHQLTKVYPNHHATQPIVLAVTQYVGYNNTKLKICALNEILNSTREFALAF